MKHCHRLPFTSCLRVFCIGGHIIYNVSRFVEKERTAFIEA